ncbi:Franean1_4349 family RiPP [Oscillochloris sp. ZM17-4]|uniref:Franean1_4349 family RiPP n=1 Tax=Oscillochloris sp. ZM17-4 TaxID=2866714 RepID=UPI001C72BC67|nr:Franean1_4349 family RiPP [Oscillochloris sp. ZM17-4]MBX0328306.1 Franean1_4349 family RiPP [Oscillochloris sp. ZM17-4]
MSPELERLIGKAVIDSDFRDKLFDNPEQALKDAGITLSPDEMDKVRKEIKERAKDRSGTYKALDTAKGSTW